jgi:hypothetical protein
LEGARCKSASWRCGREIAGYRCACGLCPTCGLKIQGLNRARPPSRRNDSHLYPALPDGADQTVGVTSEQEPGFVTIVRSRYGGAYEPGKWIAFAMWPDELPPEWNSDDVECMRFFEARKGEFGGGASPQEAYEDLLRILGNRP